MSQISNTLHIEVEYNTEDVEYGPVYIATCDALSLVTDGQTFEELLANLREAIAVSLEDTDTIAELNLTPNPQILITMRLPAHAQTA